MVEEAGVTSTEHCYIIRKEGILSGEPIVKGTRTPVRAIVELWRLGYTPEDIRNGLPHLSLPPCLTPSVTFATTRTR